MKRKLLAGTTALTLKIFVQDTSSTTGAGLTGLAYNSSGLVAYYIRNGDSSPTAITLATATVGTWASGGFKEVNSSTMPGVYEIGVPNAAIAAGSIGCVLMLRGATNMAPVLIELELDAVNYQDAAAFGLSRLDVAVSSRNATAPDNSSIATILTRTDVATSTRSSHSAADVWAVATRTLSSAGVQAIWDALTSALTTAGSIGAALVTMAARISGATVTIADPVSSTGRLTLRAGYAYTASRGNAPTWTLSTSADLSTATGYLRFVEGDGTDATTAVSATIGGSAGAWTVTADLPAATTTALLVGKALRYGVEARFGSGATPLLLASGDVQVLRTP